MLRLSLGLLRGSYAVIVLERARESWTAFRPPGLTFASISVPGCNAPPRVRQVSTTVNAQPDSLAPHLLEISSGQTPLLPQLQGGPTVSAASHGSLHPLLLRLSTHTVASEGTPAGLRGSRRDDFAIRRQHDR